MYVCVYVCICMYACLYIIFNLLNTLLMVMLLCTVFTSSLTIQPYIFPISALTIFNMVRFLVTWYKSLTITAELVSLITYLLSVKLLPSALLQVTDGTCTPVAVQVIVMLSPSLGLTVTGVVAVGD